jgi:hypothetical protein
MEDEKMKKRFLNIKNLSYGYGKGFSCAAGVGIASSVNIHLLCRLVFQKSHLFVFERNENKNQEIFLNHICNRIV